MTGQPTTTDFAMPPAAPQDGEPPRSVEPAELVLEDRFSMVPEWVLDADIGDCALRLYAVLLRYGNTTGARMPARTTLAARLHKRSVDTVDRALDELVQLGAVQVQARWAGRQRLTNQYRIRTSRPHGPSGPGRPAPEPAAGGGGRMDAATPTDAARGGRTNPARVAARMRPNRECRTQTPPPPPPPPAARRRTRGTQRTDTTRHWQARRAQLLADCGIGDDAGWADYVGQVHQARRTAGQPLTRWASAHLATALDLAVRGRGWPADKAARALLQVATDPTTRSPARLAEAGPWWDEPAPTTDTLPALDVAALEAELDEVDGKRLALQRQARQQLTAEGSPITRSSVIQRAVALLQTTRDEY